MHLSPLAPLVRCDQLVLWLQFVLLGPLVLCCRLARSVQLDLSVRCDRLVLDLSVPCCLLVLWALLILLDQCDQLALARLVLCCRLARSVQLGRCLLPSRLCRTTTFPFLLWLAPLH